MYFRFQCRRENWVPISQEKNYITAQNFQITSIKQNFKSLRFNLILQWNSGWRASVKWPASKTVEMPAKHLESSICCQAFQKLAKLTEMKNNQNHRMDWKFPRDNYWASLSNITRFILKFESEDIQTPLPS